MIDVKVLLTHLEDDQLMRKYLVSFSRDMPPLIQRMKQSYREAEWQELQICAHTYKTQANYIGDAVAHNQAVRLEEISALAQKDGQEMLHLIEQLEDRLKSSLLDIRQILG